MVADGRVLSELARPAKASEIVGQEHLLDAGLRIVATSEKQKG